MRASGPPDVNGEWDPDRVARIVANLLSNALDYSAPGSAVELSWRAEGERAAIRVANEGNPIPAEILPTVFEPFRRGELCARAERTASGSGSSSRARSRRRTAGRSRSAPPGERTVFTLRAAAALTAASAPSVAARRSGGRSAHISTRPAITAKERRQRQPAAVGREVGEER